MCTGQNREVYYSQRLSRLLWVQPPFQNTNEARQASSMTCVVESSSLIPY